MKVKIFNMPVEEYLGRFLKYVIIIAFAYGGLAALVIVVGRLGSGVENKKQLFELMAFIGNLVYVVFIVISYFIAGELLKDKNNNIGRVCGQGVIVGAACGVAVGVTRSAVNFALYAISRKFGDAAISLFSFLWKSWGYAALFVCVIDAIALVKWLIANPEIINKLKGSGRGDAAGQPGGAAGEQVSHPENGAQGADAAGQPESPETKESDGTVEDGETK